MCTGGLAAIPIVKVPSPTEPLDLRIMQSGCFDGPMAGNTDNKNGNSHV